MRLAATARGRRREDGGGESGARGGRAGCSGACSMGRPARALRPRPPSARRAPHARPRAGVKRRSARTHGPSAGGGRRAPARPSAWLGASAMSSGNPGAAVIRAAPVYITCQAQRGCLSKQRAVAPRRVGVKGSAAWPRTGAARPGAAQASPARQQGVLDGFPSPAAPEGQPCACAP